jgi:hypothetical protein
MEEIHGDWQHMSAQEAADLEAEAGIISYISGRERPQTERPPQAGKKRRGPQSYRAIARAADGRALIAEGEELDEPTVDVPEGFDVTQALRLRGRTPEEIDELRGRINDSRRFDHDGYPYRPAAADNGPAEAI